MLCYPGLVNTHHHLYQQFSRNLPQVQDMELFDWLKTLYEIWKNLDADVIRLSSQTGMGELMKYGCTTCFDHHYVFPAGSGDLIGAQMEAADALGMRMVSSRGSMDLSVKDGGLPPDSGRARPWTKLCAIRWRSLRNITIRRLARCGRWRSRRARRSVGLGGAAPAERHSRAAVSRPPTYAPL